MGSFDAILSLLSLMEDLSPTCLTHFSLEGGTIVPKQMGLGRAELIASTGTNLPLTGVQVGFSCSLLYSLWDILTGSHINGIFCISASSLEVGSVFCIFSGLFWEDSLTILSASLPFSPLSWDFWGWVGAYAFSYDTPALHKCLLEDVSQIYIPGTDRFCSFKWEEPVSGASFLRLSHCGNIGPLSFWGYCWLIRTGGEDGYMSPLCCLHLLVEVHSLLCSISSTLGPLVGRVTFLGGGHLQPLGDTHFLLWASITSLSFSVLSFSQGLL